MHMRARLVKVVGLKICLFSAVSAIVITSELAESAPAKICAVDVLPSGDIQAGANVLVPAKQPDALDNLLRSLVSKTGTSQHTTFLRIYVHEGVPETVRAQLRDKLRSYRLPYVLSDSMAGTEIRSVTERCGN
jgi:hypothetical protein